MHCQRYCLELPKNKDGTVPKHYGSKTPLLFGWEQRVCPASGTRDYVSKVARCRRRRSESICPCCGQQVKTKRDGRFSKHDDPRRGQECEVSKANRVRSRR